MRLSMLKEDPGYEAYQALAARLGIRQYNVKVFLDGIEQKHCITVDTETNYMLRYVFPLQLDDFGHALTEEPVGVVTIEIPE